MINETYVPFLKQVILRLCFGLVEMSTNSGNCFDCSDSQVYIAN